MHASTRFLSWVILLGAFAVSAQTLPGAPDSNIDLNVVVNKASGPPVADLKQSDFTVLDNKAPQQIRSFHVLTTRDAARITVVVDAVNVPFSSLAYQRNQVTKFLLANGGQLQAPTQLMVFTDQGIESLGDYSTNGTELSAVLSHKEIGLRDIRRSSQFQASERLDVSLKALRTLVNQQAQLPGRKMVLWVSPGWPLLSGPNIDLDAKQQNQIFADVVDLSNTLRRTQIVLYNINPIGAGEDVFHSMYYEAFLKPVTKPSQAQLADVSLQVLAMQSGGLALMGSNDIAGLLEQCARDAQASYQLSYVPASVASGNGYHLIEVQVNQPGLKARTRQGYYLQQPGGGSHGQ